MARKSICPSRAHPIVAPATKFGAFLWLLCFQFFMAEQIARLGFHGAYSMTTNMISDLGALRPLERGTGFSPLHALMNASFVLQGLLIAGGALPVRRLFPARPLFGAAFICFGASGLGVLIVGLAPEDASANSHVLGAALHFVGGGLAMLLFGIADLRHTEQRTLPATVSIGAGVLALTATLALGFSRFPSWTSSGWPPGAIERAAAYPLPLWLTATGFLLLTRAASGAVRLP